MPPKVKYSREAVLDAALALARRDGLQAVNARAVAKELGCSTQPLFREFQSMEQIRAEVLRMAGDAYGEYMRRSAALAPTPYKGTGMAYILFAREEPELFKLLFMRDRTGEAQEKFGEDKSMEYIMPALVQSTGFTR
ncbi:MAG: TetR family transcriptional regulator, partial [Eubacteriales bacterium]|nr:TetR family transcriptional regulator [Eubacteriales bacterium]